MPKEVVTTASKDAGVDHSVTPAQLQALLSAPKDEQVAALESINQFLAGLTAQERVAWGLAYLPGEHALSSSFGRNCYTYVYT